VCVGNWSTAERTEVAELNLIEGRRAEQATAHASADSQVQGMEGQSPLSATGEQRARLTALAGSRDRGEADRARAVLLTLAGWTSPRIAEAFGVRQDTVRL
jgi:hypothetical protein